MMRLFTAVSCSLLLCAVAPRLWLMVVASVFIGLTASVTHIVLPIAPEVADEADRGRAIGTVMTGLLTGRIARARRRRIHRGLAWLARRLFYGVRLQCSIRAHPLVALPAAAACASLCPTHTRAQVTLGHLPHQPGHPRISDRRRTLLCCLQDLLDHAGLSARHPALPSRAGNGRQFRYSGRHRSALIAPFAGRMNDQPRLALM